VPRLAAGERAERRRTFIDAGRRCLSRQAFSSVTVDDVCAEARVSKGAFYTYFASKADLLIALLEEEAAAFDEVMDDLERTSTRGDERLHRLARAMLERGADPAGLQMRADLWAEMPGNEALRTRWAEITTHQRTKLRSWIESGARSGELAEVPANALAAILLSLGDGLMLHARLDPKAFRWQNIGTALDGLIRGVSRS
jgi:AcrR family transcriptional regulator